MSSPPAVNITLRQVRESRDLTQQELADLLHTSQAAVARWESGRGGIRLATLHRVVEALGYTLNVIIAPPPPTTGPEQE